MVKIRRFKRTYIYIYTKFRFSRQHEQQQRMKWVGVAFYFLGAAFGIFQLVIISMHHTNLRRTRTKKIIFCSFTLAFLLRKFGSKTELFFNPDQAQI